MSMTETTDLFKSAIGDKYLVFSIFNRLYAFPADIIGEVANCDPLFPLPLLPSYVLGVLDRYSVPYALLDTGFLLSKTRGPHTQALVIKSDIDRVAFAIESVSGIANVAPDQLLSIESSSDQDVSTSVAYASFNWNGSDVFVLDVRRLLALVTDKEA
jgi:purine-binding chemotaxis protein CheW